MKGLRILLLGLAICLASGVKAQIYNSDVLFYVKESASLSNPQTYVRIYRFKNGECHYVNKSSAKELKTVCDNLKSSNYYYESHSELWQRDGDVGTFDSKLSNTKWNVYSQYFERLYIDGVGEEWPNHTQYHAWRKDFSQFMAWEEPEYDNRWGHSGARSTWKQLTKAELLKLSFTGARDFLQ